MCGLIVRFITERTIAGVAINMSRVEVATALGKPEWWEGHLPKSMDESDVWRYAKLQIVFDNNRVSAISLLFESIDMALPPPTFELPATEVDSTTTLDDFVCFLQTNKIAFNRASDVTGKPILRMPHGVVARFSRSIDHNRSVEEGRLITSQHLYLVSIKVGGDQLVPAKN